MSDITPPNYSTAIGQVRLLIPDTEQLEQGESLEYIFNDAQIQAFLTLYSNDIKKAAAQAKLVLASSEALINKVIKTYDFSTDGAKLGAELRAQAKMLFDEAEKDALLDGYDTFDIVQLTYVKGDEWL